MIVAVGSAALLFVAFEIMYLGLWHAAGRWLIAAVGAKISKYLRACLVAVILMLGAMLASSADTQMKKQEDLKYEPTIRIVEATARTKSITS